jgi:Type II CAAX prenyl endopeptidase Rce1-like
LLLRTEFFDFLNKPKVIDFSLEGITTRLKNIFQLYSVDMLIGFVGATIAMITENLIHYNDQHSAIDLLLEKSTFLKLFYIVSLLAPFVEETAFRLFLRPTKFNLAFGFSTFTCVWVGAFLDLGGYEKLTIIVLLTSIMYFIFLYKENVYLLFSQFIQKHYTAVFYLSAMLFALRHIWNFEVSKVWYVAPLLVIPQFSSGIVLGYVRIKYGIIYSMALHGFINFIVSIPAVLFYRQISETAKEIISKSDFVITEIAKNDQFIIGLAGFFIITLMSLIIYNSLIFLFKKESLISD